MHALVDFGTFYLACEKIFNPSLREKPVAILNNSSGYIICGSPQAKILGLKNGINYHEAQVISNKNNTVLLIANYSLYWNIFARIRHIFQNYSTGIKLMSVDKILLDIAYPLESLLDIGWRIKQEIKQCIGLNISIGLGPNATYASIANTIAHLQKTGVSVYNTALDNTLLLQKINLQQLPNFTPQNILALNLMGINNVHELRRATWEFLSESFKKLLNSKTINTIHEIQLQPIENTEKPIKVDKSHALNLLEFKANSTKNSVVYSPSTFTQFALIKESAMIWTN